jgi:MinD superfamily P-loop ATPase
MEEQGYETVEEIIGLGQQYICDNEEVEFSANTVVSETDEFKCTGCGVCVDNICVARYWDGGTAKASEENCTGCGACMIACTADAIRLVQRVD